MIIKKIQRNKLYLSNDEIMDISPLIRIKYDLKVDDNILENYDDIVYEAAVEKGMFLLSLKDRTKKELFLKLKEKYKNIQMIEKAVERIEELGYINDLNYTINYILSKKYGKSRISYSLFQKGISKEIIESAYEYIEENEREDNTQTLEDEKLEKLLLKNIKKDERKLIQYLLRQGFEFGKIIDKLKKYKEETSFDEFSD